MYYELLILGRLMYGPYHGYRIADVIGDIIGPWQKVSTGTLYPLLARLERGGLIASLAARGGSRRIPRPYVITPAGRDRFHELMLDTTSSVGDYQRVFHLKVPHLEFLAAAERAALIEHYRDYCRAAIRHQEKNTRDLGRWLAELVAGGLEDHDGQISRAGLENALEVTRHWIARWQAELAWTERLLERAASAESAEEERR